MNLLGVSLTLCGLLALSRAVPIIVNGTMSKHTGLCEYERYHSYVNIGGFVPQCDAYGNFLPQQCSASTGYCWCVDIITGEEKPNTRTPPGATPFSCDKEIYCPNGWSQFDRRCFIFITSPKSWLEAESYCLFEGANLASVENYKQDHFIQALTKGSTHSFPETWLGGHDAIYHCFWMWSDGSKFYYENWYKDCEMVEAEHSQHCLMMNYGYERKWSYASCNETLPFVCAKSF